MVMYIKSVRKTNGKTKKEYHTLHLVESYQSAKGPRQRLILNLGPLDIQPEQYKELAKAVEQRLQSQSASDPGQLSLMDCKDYIVEDTIIATHAEKAYKRITEEKLAEPTTDKSPSETASTSALTIKKPRAVGDYT
jgi:hypothetical protein